MNYLFIIVFASILVGCSTRDPVSQSGEAQESVRTIVDKAYSRAMLFEELGGEKDEFFVTSLGEFFARANDEEIATKLRSLPPTRVAAVRVFLKRSDFQGVGSLLKGKQMPFTLSYLDEIQDVDRWPIEEATAEAWNQPHLHLDW